MKRFSRNAQRHRRHQRSLVRGSRSRPRLVVFRSHQYVYCQVIDDRAGHTLCSASSRNLAASPKANRAAAQQVGEMIARLLQQKQIKRVVFDRNGYLYHGRVRTLAEAVKNYNIQF